jgi:hypothetical protein
VRYLNNMDIANNKKGLVVEFAVEDARKVHIRA